MNEPLPHQHVVFIVAIAVAALAALSDWRRGEIPNWLTYGALVLGPMLQVGPDARRHEPVERRPHGRRLLAPRSVRVRARPR